MWSVLDTMVVLEQGMKLEAFLCPVLYNTTVLVWKTGKYDDTTEKAPVAYIGEVNKKGKSQQAVKLANDAWEASD